MIPTKAIRAIALALSLGVVSACSAPICATSPEREGGIGGTGGCVTVEDGLPGAAPVPDATP